jgi:hypothetical protein
VPVNGLIFDWLEVCRRNLPEMQELEFRQACQWYEQEPLAMRTPCATSAGAMAMALV